MKLSKSEAVDYIEKHTWSKTRLGLSRTKELLALLGNPQNQLSFIHVAGSNGKGSACAMLESILRCAGYKTGLYTSPYLIDFNEQLKINNTPISGEELARIVEKVAPVADSMQDHPSRFEILTAVAMLYFLENNCDIVILEVGMGGALDSTNVILAPICALIMNIGIEHSEFLGNTIEEIANTKAGIIKSGCSCVCYDGDHAAVEVVKRRCKELNVSVRIPDFSKITTHSMNIDGMIFSYKDRKDMHLPMVGTHQLKNAATVLEAADSIKEKGFRISEKNIIDGLKSASWEARFQILSHHPLFILDGGHNPQCAKAITETLSSVLPDEKFTILFGMLADKDHDSIIEMLLPFAKSFICVTPDNPRALTAEDVAKKIKEHLGSDNAGLDVVVAPSVEDGIRDCIETNDSVLALGSLYMAGTVLEKYTGYAKAFQRKTCKTSRNSLSKKDREDFSRAICKKLIENPHITKASTILSYMPIDSEADVGAFNEWALKNGKILCFPKAGECGIIKNYIVNDFGHMTKGTFGIMEPDTSLCEQIDPERIDVIIVPCVGFDDKGRRLGHGAGYYDRFLPLAKNAKSILVAFNAQRLAEVTVDIFDVAMDEIITER